MGLTETERHEAELTSFGLSVEDKQPAGLGQTETEKLFRRLLAFINHLAARGGTLNNSAAASQGWIVPDSNA